MEAVVTKGLYKTLILGGALNWLLAGMFASRLLARFDAGIIPTLNDTLLLACLLIGGVLNAVALLRAPITSRPDGASAPAA
jgi:hypothetical protein